MADLIAIGYLDKATSGASRIGHLRGSACALSPACDPEKS
jgi:hypothetical protein